MTNMVISHSSKMTIMVILGVRDGELGSGGGEGEV
jgi:hypothetical protein